MASPRLRVSSLLFNSSYLSQEQPMMTKLTCLACQHPLACPPSVAHILSNYRSSVTPQYGLNRHIPRCKHCDFVDANKKAIDAELPPPTYKNPVRDIDRHLERTMLLIEEGIRVEELEAALRRMREKLREAVRTRDSGMRKAWEEYWGIWGPEESGLGSLPE